MRVVLLALAFVASGCRGGPRRVVDAGAGTRLLGVAQGRATWVDPESCAVATARVVGSPDPVARQVSNCRRGHLLAQGDRLYMNDTYAGVVAYRLPSFEAMGGVARFLMTTAFAADGDQVFVGSCAWSGSCQIWAASLVDGEQVKLQGTDIVHVTQIAVDATSLYWLDGGERPPWGGQPNDMTARPPRLMRAPRAPRAAEETLVDGFRPSAFFLTRASVVWIDGGSVWRLAKAGGAPVAAARGGGAAAVDGDDFLFLDGRELWELRDGQPARRLATLASAPERLAADATAVYWIEAGALMALAR